MPPVDFERRKDTLDRTEFHAALAELSKALREDLKDMRADLKETRDDITTLKTDVATLTERTVNLKDQPARTAGVVSLVITIVLALFTLMSRTAHAMGF